MDKNGICIWGKKINQVEANRYTKIVDGATYIIRNLHSHMLMHIPGSDDVAGALVKQGYDNGSLSQLWKIKDAGNGYSYLFPRHSESNLVLEVRNGATNNYANLVVNPLDGTDKQKFRIVYNDNGYFHLLTKVTSDASCAEVVGYNITESGTINQNTYSGLLNQLFRFEKVDSFAIDTVSVDTFTAVRPVDELSFVQVYPNPSNDGKIFVDLTSLNNQGNTSISILDLNGSLVYQIVADRPSIVELDLVLNKGIYILRVNSGVRQYLNKLVIQ
ncbi:MAG: RICIN domain-containing protein [Bacteroidales bacterium]|nr:RICIN domain-containing protein [Bacteroidales bacterium]